MLKTARPATGGGGGGSGTVTLVSTDANLTGGPISTTGTIGLANVISFGQGNVSLTNANVGTAIVNMNMLNAAVNGLNAQIPVQYATTADLGNVSYSNGTLGDGATLTKTSPFAVLAIDGYTFTSTDVTNGTRVLVKDESSPAYNGVYTVTNIGSGAAGWVLTRSTDYNLSAEINAGDGFYVLNGSANKNTTWVQQTPAPVTVGTTSIVFTQFSSSSANVVTLNTVQTLSNKRITPRVANVTTTSTITPPGDTVDQYEVLALASGATVAAPSGTPTDGQKLILRIKDNGTAQTLSWTTSAGAYRPVAVVLPTSTVISSVFYAGCIYNQQDNYWDVVSTVQL